MRKYEYFNKLNLSHQDVISKTPKRLYPQERDWTCSIACIRTILSGIDPSIPSEDSFVELYDLKPGPLFSKDIKNLNLLENYDVIYGCDLINPSFDQLLSYINDNYFVMIESMLNFSHWFVLLGYFPSIDSDIEHGKVLVYDPYYNETRLLILDEFIQMWLDGNHNINSIEKDFIAIKSK